MKIAAASVLPLILLLGCDGDDGGGCVPAECNAYCMAAFCGWPGECRGGVCVCVTLPCWDADADADGDGDADAEACIPEFDDEFCARLSTECGALTASDNCGDERSVPSCGDCNDGNICTSDLCDEIVGCVHPPAASPCCVGSTSICDDGNGCTHDFCDPETGACSYETVPDCP